jgi:isocitrate dehydrogenase
MLAPKLAMLKQRKGPSTKTGELDNRGSHYYLALYWAQALSEQTDDKELQAHFAPLAKQLEENEQTIISELKAVQGKPVDIGGYYFPDPVKTEAVMRPSTTFNAALAAINT